MSKQKANGKAPTAPDRIANGGADAETRALNGSAEFEALMAESERAIKEGRTRPAADVFRRQRERRAHCAPR